MQGTAWAPGIRRPDCNRAARSGRHGSGASPPGCASTAASQVPNVHSAVFQIEYGAQLSNAAPGWVAKRHRECRIGARRSVAALGAITEPFPWRVRPGGPQRPGSGTVLAATGRRAPGRVANGIGNAESGHGRRVVAGMCIHGPRWGLVVLLGWVWWGFLLPPPPGGLRYGQRHRRSEGNRPSRHQSPGAAASLFWTQVSCDCFPDDCRDGPILGPVFFPAQRLIEQEAANVGRKSHGDLFEVAALSVRPVNLHGLRACDLWRAPARDWFSDYLLSGFRITCFLVNRLRRRLRRGAFGWFKLIFYTMSAEVIHSRLVAILKTA